MLKKILALSLILCLFPFSAAFAETDRHALLSELGIMTGYEDGTFRGENNLTRAEFTKIAVMASPDRKNVQTGHAISPFPDVPHALWSAPYITLAAKSGYVTGYLDGSFRPDGTVTLAEATAVFLRLLGYENSEFGASWPRGHMEIAKNIGLLAGIDKTADDAITRDNVATLLYTLLDMQMHDREAPYLSTLSLVKYENAVIYASSAEDSTLPSNKISTSVGTFKKGNTFSADSVGCRGDLFIENGDTIFAFIKKAQVTKTCAVYATLSDGIITYQNGILEKIALSDGVPLYENGAPSGTLVKSKLSMGDVLEIKYKEDDSVEYVILDTKGVDGPFTVLNQSWTNQFPVTAATAIMRNGQKVSKDAVETYDVLYYSEALDMVLAYTEKVTGVYQDAAPSKDIPSSVTVSGTTYAVESIDAFRKLSSGGGFSFGDTITLLLGRDGHVADVVGGAAMAEETVGFVTDVGTKSFVNAHGESYSASYITLAFPSGRVQTYETKTEQESLLNHVVSLRFSEGKAIAASVKSDAPYGTFSLDAYTLGTAALSPDVQILEVYTPSLYTASSVGTVFPRRLDGVELSASDFLYAARDAKNRICALIIDDVTGDLHQYGIVTRANSVSVGMHLSGSYTFLTNGNESTIATSGKTFSVGAHTPCKITYSGNQVNAIQPLTRLSSAVSDFGGGFIKTADGEMYDVTSASIYKKNRDYSYSLLSPTDLSTTDYTIVAYYDKVPSAGGKIRVLIANEK